MHWLALALSLFSAIFLVLGTLFFYLYFKLTRVTTIKELVRFIIAQLTFVVTLYVLPLWKIIIIQFVDIEPDMITSPPFEVFLSYELTLIAITYLWIQAEAKKTTQFIENQSDIKDLKAFSDKGEKTSKNVPLYKMRKPDKFSQESHLFYDRIKRIFLLRRGCTLSADQDNEILYGEIEDFG